MGWISFIILSAALANFILAFGVLWQRHTKPVHFIFAFFSITAGIWTFSNFIISITEDPRLFELVGRSAFSVAVLVPYSALLLSWHFPEIYHTPPRTRTLVATTIMTLIFLVLGLTPLIQKSIVYTDGNPTPEFGSLYFLYVLYMTGLVVWLVYNFLRSRWKTSSGRDRMQINYCLSGLAITFIGACFCNFALPQLTTSYQYYLLGSVWPLVWTSFTAYAICRYRLMDIGVVLRNILIRLITSGAILFCLLLPFFSHQWLLQEAPLAPQIIFTIGLAGLAAFYLPKYESWVKKFVDQKIFRSRYDYETAMIFFGEKLRTSLGQENIAALGAQQIPIIIQGVGAAIYLPEPGGADFVVSAQNSIPCREKMPYLSVNDQIYQTVVVRQQTISREETAYGSGFGAGKIALLDQMDSCQVNFIIPIISQGVTIGVMMLGEKKHDNVYSLEDLRLIDSLASQLAFALDNARLYQQVLESERLYKTILRHMQRGVIAVDIDLRVTMVNSAARTLFGINQENWLDQSIRQQLPDLGPLLELTIAEERNQAPREIVLSDGNRTFPCECETSIMRDGRGVVNGLLIVCQDLTEKKRFEQEIRRIDRLSSIGTLAAGVAHEIKNPLVSIQTFAQLLKDRYQDPEFRDNFGSIVRSEITRINRLIHDLLNFSSPAQGQIGDVNLHEAVDRAIELLSNDFKTCNIEIKRNYTNSPAVITGDANQLYQVFINVLQNAIQFVDKKNPVVTVTTQRTIMPLDNGQVQPGLTIAFSDNGHGIEAEHLPRIFDPFYSTRDQGSGLGLAVCHGILQNHHAQSKVDSTPGQGSVFSFTFPDRSGSPMPSIMSQGKHKV